ncbi:MAG TPA: glycosyltransferase family 2 protein [Polyangiaceae bacterium]|nr:glycosyltransferase family 2 protein [Polyangiaceae bacterium]
MTRALLVVPTLNEAPHVARVVEGLLASVPKHVEARLVVADGGSTDGTRHCVERVAERHPEVTLLDNPRRIQSAGINLAARRFGHQADVLIRCDAHAAYPPDYCARLLDTLERVHADAVVVPLDSVGATPIQRVVAWVSNSRIGTGGSAHRAGHSSGFVDHGHHAAFRMDVFRRSGGYDETFTHNEDAELDCRQRALGARIYLDGEIRVAYHPRARLGALFQQYFRYGAGRSRTIRRHPRSARLRQLAVPAHVVFSLLAVLVAPWWALPLAWPALYLVGLAAASASCARQLRIGAGWLAGPIAALMHTAWAFGFLSCLVARRERGWQRELTQPLVPAGAMGEGT